MLGLSPRIILNSSSFFFILFISIINTSKADLTQEILDGIANGTRINTKVQAPLSKVKVPEPSNLSSFVKNKQAAIELGKALFWDMQVGSDGVQACASCHFAGGADNRAKNQLSPGLLSANQDASLNPDRTFEAGKGANILLTANDFPHHKLSRQDLFSNATLTNANNEITTFNTEILRSTNDVVSSQGVHFSQFINASANQAEDEREFIDDPDGFQVSNLNTRRVEPRNTPTNVNAIFNHRNRWDGKSQNIFNGVNQFGDRDPNAFVFKQERGRLAATQVRIDHASVASQAMTPPVSTFEMGSNGRPFFEIGEKFLGENRSARRFVNQFLGSYKDLPKKDKRKAFRRFVQSVVLLKRAKLRPLAKQIVAPDDSVLGRLSAYPKKGLRVANYETMVRRAFRSEWWNSRESIRVNDDGSKDIIKRGTDDGENVYSQMEMNFSLFFGLATQLYQATLVADQTPFDKWLEGDENALTQSEIVGFFIAHDEGRCLNCHGGPELTFAAVSKVEGITLKDGTVLTEPQGLTRIRRNNLIDEGFNNIGVRPTLEDLGVGGNLGTLGPISFARQKHLGEIIVDPVTGDPVSNEETSKALGADGAFKIPGLRNLTLTAPYFHNGGEANLEDVIAFYFRGGNFRQFRPTQLTDCASSITPDQARLVDHPVQGFNAERTEEVIITGLGILRGPLANSGPGADTHPVGDCTPNDGFSDGITDPNDGLDGVDRANLVAWLKSLTDPRLVNRSAPFDHPQLFVPNGHPGDNTLTDSNDGIAADQFIEIPAVGAAGGDPLPLFNAQLGQ